MENRYRLDGLQYRQKDLPMFDDTPIMLRAGSLQNKRHFEEGQPLSRRSKWLGHHFGRKRQMSPGSGIRYPEGYSCHSMARFQSNGSPRTFSISKRRFPFPRSTNFCQLSPRAFALTPPINRTYNCHCLRGDIRVQILGPPAGWLRALSALNGY